MSLDVLKNPTYAAAVEEDVEQQNKNERGSREDDDRSSEPRQSFQAVSKLIVHAQIKRRSSVEGQKYALSELLAAEEYSWMKHTHYLRKKEAKHEAHVDNALSVLYKERWVELSFGVIFLWLFCGTSFYKLNSRFTTAQAFYFAVQSGFSVGFGVSGVTCTDAEDAEACRWYTIFHVLVGSSVIAVALGMWADALVKDSHAKRTEMVEIIRDRHLSSHHCGSQNVTVENVENGKRESEGHAQTDAERNGGDGEDESYDTNSNFLHVTPFARAFILFVMFIVGGCIFGEVHEKWRMSQSLLYSISAMSTGGLESPSSDITAMWFTGWFCFFGVPLYGYVVVTAGGRLQTLNHEAEVKASLDKGFKKETARLLRVELKRRSKTAMHAENPRIDWAHFLELYLVKLDLADTNDLRKIRDKYESMIVGETESTEDGLSIHDVNVDILFHEFQRTSVTGRYFLDFSAFAAICVIIIEDEHRFTELDMEEFMQAGKSNCLGSKFFLLKSMKNEDRLRALFQSFARPPGDLSLRRRRPSCTMSRSPSRTMSSTHDSRGMELETHDFGMTKSDLYKFLQWYTDNLCKTMANIDDPIKYTDHGNIIEEGDCYRGTDTVKNEAVLDMNVSGTMVSDDKKDTMQRSNTVSLKSDTGDSQPIRIDVTSTSSIV